MKRGDIIVVAPPSPFNKPRPALIVQSSIFDEIEKVTVALISGDLTRAGVFRIPINPTATNGLRKPSQIQVDHLQTVELRAARNVIGEVDAVTMRQVAAAMRIFFGL